MPEARVIEQLPSLPYRLELENKSQVLAHTAGSAQKNFVRLFSGDRVEVELASRDLNRGRITKRNDSQTEFPHESQSKREEDV